VYDRDAVRAGHRCDCAQSGIRALFPISDSTLAASGGYRHLRDAHTEGCRRSGSEAWQLVLPILPSLARTSYGPRRVPGSPSPIDGHHCRYPVYQRDAAIGDQGAFQGHARKGGADPKIAGVDVLDDDRSRSSFFTGEPASAPNYSSFTVTSSTNSSSPPVYTASGVCTNSGPVYTMTGDSGTCTSIVTWTSDNNYSGATLSQTTTAAPGTPPPKTLHVGNLTGTASSRGSYWVGGVSTLVHDANHAIVARAKVTGGWSTGSKSSGSCTTTTGGFCTITSGRISNASSTVTFTVKSITLSGHTYTPSANHDISGDSKGTTMTLSTP